MDVSPEYVKMCEKAEEIQRSRPPIIPTTLYRFEDGKEVDCRGDYIASVRSDDCVLLYKYIWLPCQDQLQAMLKGTTFLGDHWLSGLFAEFSSWVWNDGLEHLYEVNQGECSGEQLWLVFVMKVKYCKVWTGSEWVLDRLLT